MSSDVSNELIHFSQEMLRSLSRQDLQQLANNEGIGQLLEAYLKWENRTRNGIGNISSLSGVGKFLF